MTQATTWGVPRSGPATPATTFGRADDSFDALLSQHKGATAPTYAVAGTRWWDDSVANTITIKEYDGSDWIVVGTIDTAANSFIPGDSAAAVRSALGVSASLQPFVDMASATTTDIGAAASRNINLTGAAVITSLGTAPAGTLRFLRATGTPTLTHNATSLILQTGSNIVMRVGDTVWAFSLGSGNWFLSGYARANGVPLADDFTVFLRDQKPTSTGGGTFTQDAWRTRDLNTEIDPKNICTLASNQFVLAAGTYDITFSAPGYSINRHQTRLRNVTAGVTVSVGEIAISNAASPSGNRSGQSVRVTLNGTDALEVQHYCQTTFATLGLGVEAPFGEVGIFTTVMIRKVG